MQYSESFMPKSSFLAELSYFKDNVLLPPLNAPLWRGTAPSDIPSPAQGVYHVILTCVGRWIYHEVQSPEWYIQLPATHTESRQYCDIHAVTTAVHNCLNVTKRTFCHLALFAQQVKTTSHFAWGQI